MTGDTQPYPEIPMNWTISREMSGPERISVFYGLNKLTGKETVRFRTYGGALNEVEQLEIGK